VQKVAFHRCHGKIRYVTEDAVAYFIYYRLT